MIHVLCMNPAIDKQYFVRDFIPGRSYTDQVPSLFPGGKGINCARVFSQLGEPVHLIALLGANADCITEEMRNRCDCIFLPVDGPCRVTVNIIDEKQDRETVLSERGPTASPAVLAKLHSVLEACIMKGDIIVASGSLMCGLPRTLYREISRLCENRQAKCALDCNASLLPPSIEDAHYFLGKPNEMELCAMLGREPTSDPKELYAGALGMRHVYDNLLVSMGNNGGLLVTGKGAYKAKLPVIPIRSAVGSGDATFAGALTGFVRQMEDEDILRLAMACGLSNATHEEVGFVDPDEVHRLMGDIEVTRVS
ncbi:MAG: hexose kinase [Clostridia bacterium]|nr:hexose kinase [Clostridia bacterium]